MKHFLRVIGGAALALGMVGPVMAAGWYSGSIAQVQVDSSGSINVYLSNTGNNECGSTRVNYVNHVIGNDDAKAILAALLAWQAQGLTVQTYIQSCAGNYGIFSSAYNQ